MAEPEMCGKTDWAYLSLYGIDFCFYRTKSRFKRKGKRQPNLRLGHAA
jgi:hypothetical protein